MLKLRKTPPLIDFARMAWRRFAGERCLQIAFSLTFAALLAVVPIITVALTLLSAFPVFREVMLHIQQFLVANMLPEAAESIAAYAGQFAENAGKLTAVGVAFLFVTAMIVLQTIDRALNQIWRVPRPRAMTQRIFNYWALIRDAAEISVADVYHQFVFRPGARLPARQSGQELDHLALELAGGIEGRLQLPLAELFRRAAAEPAAAPLRIQAV